MKVAVPIAAYSQGTTGDYVARSFHHLGHEATILTPEQFYQAFIADTYDLYFCVDSSMPLNLMQPEFGASALTKVCFWQIDYRTGWRTRIPSDLETARLLQARGGWVFQAQFEDMEHCQAQGISRCSWLPLAADPDIWHPASPAIDPPFDLGFVRNLWDETRPIALEMIEAEGINLIFPGHGEAVMDAGARILQQARIGFNISSFFGSNLAYDINMRVFETLSCGRPLVTNWMPGLERLGLDGAAFVRTYRNLEDLVPTIQAALQDESFLASGDRAREFILSGHTYDDRIRQAIATWEQERQGAVVQLTPLYRASVVVPWWDHTELLSYWEHNLVQLEDAEVIFIDNGSAPEGKAALEVFCQRHGVRLIRNQRNCGFAAANNQGTAAATGDYIVFMNNDVEILKPLIQSLCHAAGQNVAGPGPMLTDTGEVFLEGWALCMSKSVLEAIGGWCEDYGPGYWDDVDLCNRAILQGYQLNPLANFFSGNWTSSKENPLPVWINHLGGTTGQDGRLNTRALDERNRVLFDRKFYPQLRQINLIVFPDWTQPEDVLYETFATIVQTLSAHPDHTDISVLIDTSGYIDEQVEMLVSGMMMHAAMDRGQDWSDSIELSIVTKRNQTYWSPWEHRLHARIILPDEDGDAITQRGKNLPAYTIDEFNQIPVLRHETKRWHLLQSPSRQD